jgi:CRP-like cAMP-binding protein
MYPNRVPYDNIGVSEGYPFSRAMAKVVVNPESDLEPRPGDLQLTSEELQRLSLFKGMSKPPSFEKYPGATVLRRYSQGEVICRQGDGGATAFYILSSEDALELNSARLEQARAKAKGTDPGRQKQELDQLAKAVEHFSERIKSTESEGPAAKRRAATAHLLVNLETKPKKTGFLQSVTQRLFGGANGEAPEQKPDFIPNDGPADIDYRTRQAPMFEGDVFGEMSCMTLAPRSATVVADVDCFMLEFLRNIFDQVQKDPGYRERMDANYRERVLKNHLRRLEILHDLSDHDLDFIRDRADLMIVDPGTVIFDEYDASDGVYIVRSGLVQVLADTNVMLGADEITDWQAFCRELAAADEQPATGAAT